jgi:hypothetical protein
MSSDRIEKKVLLHAPLNASGVHWLIPRSLEAGSG